MKRIFINLMMLSALFLSSCGTGGSGPSSTSTSSSVPTPTESSSSSTPKETFLITFYDENGTKLHEENFEEGSIPSYTYNKVDTVEWDYTVDGWATTQGGTVLTALPAVSEAASYYAIVSQKKQQYTLTFNSNGGSNVESQKVDYGSEISEPTKPTYEGHKFICWCLDEALENKVTWPLTLTGNQTIYASWNESVNIKGFLATLLSEYLAKPSDYIPATMLPGAPTTLVSDPTTLTDDYSNTVDISSINYHGFGGQWEMVVDNIIQSDLFYNALTIVSTISSAATVAFNNYIDKNPSDTASFSTTIKEQSLDYSVKINFNNNLLEFVIEGSINSLTAQIYLSLNVVSNDIDVRVQLGDSEAIRYTKTTNSYTFGIRYLGMRRAYFNVVKKDDGSIAGKIYEYLGVDEVSTKVSSCAEFYINDDYVSVVGNKANGLVGFKGYINELYDAKTGYYLGSEVRETATYFGITGTYNTLWFTLKDISGLNKIKMLPNDPNSEVHFASGYRTYINESDEFFFPTYNTYYAVQTSRKYDIELRNFYYYYLDSSTNTYVSKCLAVPCMFIQDDNAKNTNYSDFTKDMKKENGLTCSVIIAPASLAKIRSDYATIVDTFIQDKSLITVDFILDYIGDKKVVE